MNEKKAILTVTETKRKNSKYHYKVVEVNTHKVINQHYSNDIFLAVVLDSHKPIYCRTVELAESYKKKYNLEIAVLETNKQALQTVVPPIHPGSGQTTGLSGPDVIIVNSK